MKSKFKKLMAAALVLCLMLALLPAGVLAEGPYNITVASPLVKGSIEVSGSATTANEDDTVTFTAKPQDGSYGVLSVRVYGTAEPNTEVEVTPAEASTGNTGDRAYSFTMPAYDVTITAEFRAYKTVTIDNYSVTTSPSGSAMIDSTVTVTPAAAPEGYTLSKVWWKATDGTGVENTIDLVEGKYEFTMPEYNVTVGATFEQIPEPVPEKYAVNTAAPQNGTLSVDKTEAAEGDTVKVTANAANGYVLDSLYYIDNNNKLVNISTDTMSFEMPASAVTVHAWFREVSLTHDVKVSYSTGGTVTASPNTDVATGTPVTLTVTPAEGYWLKSLKIDGVEFANYVDWSYFWYYKYGTVSFTMTDADVSVYAEFTDQLYVFTNYNGYRGEVEVLVKDDASGEWVDTNFADTDDWVAFKPVAYTNFNIGAISVTGNWTGRSYDVETWYWHNGWYYFRMPSENVTINVEFTDNSHAVNVKDASNGTLKTNTKWAVEDERVYITAVPDKGYELTWLSVKAEDGTKIDVYEAIKEDTYYFFMPDQAVTVSAIFAYDYPDMPFTDVNSNSWYFNAVEFVYNKGIMQGVSSTKFSPNGTVTRGMLVTMLWRMAGEPYVGGGSFDDVASGSYYATAVAWAAKNGIVDGYNSTRFGPNDAVTREQIATMLYRYAKWLGYSASGSSLAGYSDASSVSSWAKDAMGWAVKNSVVTGVTATKLNPASSATRAETAQMFMNFYEYLN